MHCIIFTPASVAVLNMHHKLQILEVSDVTLDTPYYAKEVLYFIYNECLSLFSPAVLLNKSKMSVHNPPLDPEVWYAICVILLQPSVTPGALTLEAKAATHYAYVFTEKHGK